MLFDSEVADDPTSPPSRWFSTDFDLDFRHPQLSALHQRWLELRGGDAIPPRTAFDPLDFKPFLGNIFMIEVDDAGERFKYRLVGTLIVEVVGRDSTGRWLDDAYADSSPVISFYRELVRRRSPGRSHGIVEWVGKDHMRFETGTFPLALDDGRIGRFVGATYYGR